MVQVILQISKSVLSLVEYLLKRIKEHAKALNSVNLLIKILSTKNIVVLTLIRKLLNNTHNSKIIIPKKLRHICKFLPIISLISNYIYVGSNYLNFN